MIPRYAPTAGVHEAPEGRFVLFADVEEALRDSKRLEWLRPLIEGDSDAGSDRRTAALMVGIVKNLSGNELVDAAMKACPE